MQLTPKQLKEFDELGYLVLPDCFSDEEMAVLRSEAEGIYDSRAARRSGARSRARRARPSPPTPTTRRSASSAAIRA